MMKESIIVEPGANGFEIGTWSGQCCAWRQPGVWCLVAMLAAALRGYPACVAINNVWLGFAYHGAPWLLSNAHLI